MENRQTDGTVVSISEFKGLWQYGQSFSGDPRYAMECENAQTREGVLRPMAACRLLNGALDAPIETLARLHRRWHTQQEEHDVLVAASGGQLYWMLPGGESWTQMTLPAGWNGDCYQSNAWSYVAYEMNPEGSDAPVDVLLMSNARDGMVCVRGDTMTVSRVETPQKFGVIARHAERIWGGAIAGNPDMLAYSAPFDPFDWRQNTESPEDGAGDVMQPSWDGDSFTTLTPFGDQLMALKRTRVWRILGASPGEYAFKEQYGGGAPFAATVAVDGTRILMLGRQGLLCYDGESVIPYYQEMAGRVFEQANPQALENACACLWRDTYYLALPLDGAKVNNAVLAYNTREGTFLLRRDVQVESFLPTENALYFTSATTPGRVWLWQDDCWQKGCMAQPMRWVGPWCDLGRKDVHKGGFTVYITVENHQAMQLRLSIQTDRKIKTKTLTFPALPAGAESRQKSVRFGGGGRRFRLKIASDGSAPWRLVGGVQIQAELDAD